jgi:hypothetical protein
MAKRGDKNDSTMDISASQLVSGHRPQPPGVNKNDVSMWIGGVVGADEFSGSKKRVKKSRAPLAIGRVALLAAAGGGAYYMFGRQSSTTPVANSAPIDAQPTPQVPAAPIATAPPPLDAGIEMDAAVPDAGVALAADAVSGADPKHKTTTTTKKKKVVKKPVVKKKSTTKRR